jgi:ABC-type Fe3+-hydroxamate transport system substrate-binding protein
VTETEISELNPDYILLSSEPYPFKEKDILELQHLCPNSKVLLVDGEVFSWYGSRLIHKVDYIEDFVNNLVN